MVCVYEQYVIQEHIIIFRKPPLLGPPLSLPELRPVHLLRVFLLRVLESNFPGDPP